MFELSEKGWTWGCSSQIDLIGRVLFTADAHRDNGRRFIVSADERLTAFAISDSSGSFEVVLHNTVATLEEIGNSWLSGNTQIGDAAACVLPDDSANIWFTDPPYYDAMWYAELSDFFYVWLRRLLPEHPLIRDPFDSTNRLTPKTREIIQDESYVSIDGNPKDRGFFEKAIT